MNKESKIIILVFLLLVFMPFVLSEEGYNPNAQVPQVSERVKNAQSVLDVSGFDAGSAFGVDFSDYIDPATGSLTISHTDAVVKGRNGMDIVISRKWNSNTFLNINQIGTVANFDCLGPDSNGINDFCYNCDLGNANTNHVNSDLRIDSSGEIIMDFERPMGKCENPTLDEASFKRQKYLGDWKINYLENRVKDPTSLIFGNNGGGDLVGTYEFTSSRGINSMSMVLDNNEIGLILPQMFDVADTATSSSIWWGVDNIDVMSMFLGTDWYSFTSLVENSQFDPGESAYVVYTEDYSPLIIYNYFNPEGAESIPNAIHQSMTYLGKDRRIYYFQHPVNFCSKWDDLRLPSVTEDEPVCSVALPFSDDRTSTIRNWAENPYAGVYLTQIVDDYGNEIVIEYNDDSPFVDRICNAGHYWENGWCEDGVVFKYDNVLEGGDINTKLNSIDYPSISNTVDYIQRKYELDDETGLLSDTYLINYGGSNPGEIPGTRTSYSYNGFRELTQVTLPSGAGISYTYAWADEIPSVDPLFDTGDGQMDTNKMQRRVVITKRITNGGYCPGPKGCEWNYKYITSVGLGGPKTIVTDPWGNDAVYYLYPNSVAPFSYNR